MTKYTVLDKLDNGFEAGDVLCVPADVDQKTADLLLEKGRIVEQENRSTEESITY